MVNLNTIEISHSDAKQLAFNLSSLIESHNLNTNQLANKLGVPMMTVRRLVSGETTDPRISTLKLIADYFDVTIDALLQEHHQNISSFKAPKPHFVPKLDWDTAERNLSNNTIDITSWKNWQPILLNEIDSIGKRAFAIESRPSMYPRFPLGSVFIIDPDEKPRDGDIVLIKLKENNELTLRQLSIDPPEWVLHPTVPGSTLLSFSKNNHEIVGVNILTFLNNRR